MNGQVNLGYPLLGPLGVALKEHPPHWCMTLINDEGGAYSVAFSAEQAKEMARRIIAFYGEPFVPLERYELKEPKEPGDGQ